MVLMPRIRLFVSLIALISTTAAFAHEENNGIVEIYLKRILYAGGERLCLEDIVQTYSDFNIAQDLAKMEIPFAEDRIVVYSAAGVRETIRERYRGGLIVVGQRLTIIPAGMCGSEACWFYEKLADFVSESNLPDGARLEIEIPGVPEIPGEQDTDIRFEFKSQTVKGSLRKGNVRISIVSAKSGRIQSLDLVIHIFIPVLVPKTVIHTGESFGPDRLLERIVDLAQYRDDLLLAGRSEISFSATGELAPGEPIPVKKVTKTLYVKAGDRVTIYFVKKNMLVEVSGRVSGSGGLDDSVTVKPDGADKKFQGVVTGMKEVTVELQ